MAAFSLGQNESPQVFGEIAPADPQRRCTVLYDTDILSQLQEFAYIYSRGELSFSDGGHDQRPIESAGPRPRKHQPSPSAPSIPCYSTGSGISQVTNIAPRCPPILVRAPPPSGDPTDLSQNHGTSSHIGKKGGETVYPELTTARPSAKNIPNPSPPQSISCLTQSCASDDSFSSKKRRRFKRPQERGVFGELMKSANAQANSTSTLFKIKSLLHINSSSSLELDTEARPSPASPAGSWIRRKGRKILSRSRSTPSSKGSGGADEKGGDRLDVPRLPSSTPSTSRFVKRSKQTPNLSPPQSISFLMEPCVDGGCPSSKEPRRTGGRRERGDSGERMGSGGIPTISTSTPALLRLKALFHPRSNGSVDLEAEAKRSPSPTTGRETRESGERTVFRSGSPQDSGGLDVPLTLSTTSGTETRRQATTPTGSDPSTNPSSYSPPSRFSTALSSLSSSLTVLPHYSMNTRDSPSPPSIISPWQCTFCLQQLGGRAAWLDHEELHIQEVCLEEGYDCAMGNDNANWFYPCGFCSVLLRTWPERREHISDHYDNETTMASWDPLTSPYPVYRHDFSFVRGFPACWNWGTLLGAQRVAEEESGNTGDPQEKRYRCPLCSLCFPDIITSMRHTEIWHSHPTSFTCPPLTTTQTPGLFEPYDRHHDICLLCGELYPPDDWGRHLRHLKKAHGFTRCSHREAFYREEQFVRHAANAHAVGIEWLSGFVGICRRDEKPPALAIEREVVR
ncbi:MAG: hypothetical protein M1840_004507 [Geoglossum simile]|nr:MAG: hypothetical protein M1840_004507 [Geoglossum simile]